MRVSRASSRCVSDRRRPAGDVPDGGHLATDDDKFNPNLPVTRDGPPLFIVQAEDDYTDDIHQSLIYYAALASARVPAEMHLYAQGRHAFVFAANELSDQRLVNSG